MTPSLRLHTSGPATRRRSREVMVGKVGIGGENPVRVQSMITCDTMDTAASVQQSLDLANVGSEIVRITAPTVKDARNLEFIKQGLLAAGCDVPLVADIHFKPDAAMEAARWVEKVRVNPGNFADSKKFAVKEYTDEQYAAELGRIRERFTPLVELCKQRGISVRIGTNHGSLSDRIMNRYGDTPLGMVESALEFARIAREHDFHQLIFSMKASNPKVMIAAYRLLVDRLAKEGPDWNYPVHLGVTEAGDGEDGRIKSAIGIGSLLNDGIGDTIRVSLTEDSIHEIPVARALVGLFATGDGSTPDDFVSHDPVSPSFDPFSYRRRNATHLRLGDVALGLGEVPRVVVRQATLDKIVHKLDRMGDFQPEIVYEQAGVRELDPRDQESLERLNREEGSFLVTVADGVDLPVVAAFRLLAARLDERHPILLKDTLNPSLDQQKDFLHTMLVAATNLGALLCDGIGDAVLIQGEEAPGPESAPGLQHPPGGGFACLQDRLRRLSLLRADAVQPPEHHREDPRRDRPPQGRQDRHHGLHRERPRRDGGRRLRLRRRRTLQGESLRGQAGRALQHPRDRGCRASDGPHPRTRTLDRRTRPELKVGHRPRASAGVFSS